ncbi:MAG: UDP-3-O-(3-hydroxymyristoyl)glucosamine N-acyltransferase [Bacteroidetes bacterium]|nr:UDP-3-O-(3-hydroxymyristoyl)glucosamine N-acyltransferase [Bacteroidota bacterium]
MIKLADIINKLKPVKIIGDTNTTVNKVIRFDELNTSNDNIAWINEKNKEKLYKVKAGIFICPSTIEEQKLSPNCTYLFFQNPRKAFRELLEHFFVQKKPDAFISPSANIGNNVTIGMNVYIGHNTIIEDNVQIGDATIIYHNNTILSNTIIKENVQIGSNNTIGGIGFGYEKDEDGTYKMIPHIGNVIIEENCEIGNNTCIDRAVLGSTILKKNCKVDNLVHIAHGVVIGENSLIIAHAMIGGSTVIGKNVWVAPNSSIINAIHISDNATIGLGAVVVKNVNENEIVVGNPAKPLPKK